MFVIGPDKMIKLTLTHPVGAHGVSTPANRNVGDDVIISPTISDDDAKEKLPKGFTTLKP